MMFAPVGCDRLQQLGRHLFSAEIILCAVRWYPRYSLSYREVQELLEERNSKAALAQTTIRSKRGIGRDLLEIQARLLARFLQGEIGNMRSP
jgi:transposase-like protein